MDRKDAAWLFHEGKYNQAYEFFGAHPTEDGKVVFRVWAPNAQEVSLVGDFNNWDENANPMMRLDDLGGIWETTLDHFDKGNLYKYAVKQANGNTVLKADPYANHAELRPATASVYWPDEGYQWNDWEWRNKMMEQANHGQSYPMNIYEMNLASWKKHEDGTPLSYNELAEQLPGYLKDMGYTHVELMPIMEHPFDGSWGYQVTGYFAPSSRYGTPEEFKHLIDTLHQNDIGVILDWVPAHFCKDEHGLINFDGTKLYDANEHPHWGTMEFDYTKPEVVSFLTSNAYYWMKEFHADGLRVDGVASMLYLNYGYDDEWRRNELGGIDDLAAVALLRNVNSAVFKDFPYAIMAAEESTAYPLVTYPVDVGGLGFNYKWDMGWMHDSLDYMSTDPLYRHYDHHLVTHPMDWAFSENYILPLSHDEVANGKGSILGKMFGDYDMKFNEMRLLLTFMFARPGKKLNFMGSEFAPFDEWNHAEEIEWYMLNEPKHKKYFEFIKDLNRVYKNERALWTIDNSWDGFEWIDGGNNGQSIVSFIRKSGNPDDNLICLMNFCPLSYEDFRVGVPEDKTYHLIFNSDEEKYGGTGFPVVHSVHAERIGAHGREYSINIKVPPMSGLIYKS